MRSSSQRKSQRTDRAPVPWQRPWRPSVGSDALWRGTSANQVCGSTSFALAPTVRLQARPSRPAGCGGWSRRMTTLRSLADWPRRSSSTRVDPGRAGEPGVETNLAILGYVAGARQASRLRAPALRLGTQGAERYRRVAVHPPRDGRSPRARLQTFRPRALGAHGRSPPSPPRRTGGPPPRCGSARRPMPRDVDRRTHRPTSVLRWFRPLDCVSTGMAMSRRAGARPLSRAPR